MNEYIKAVLVKAGDKITFAAACASAGLVAACKALRNGVKDIEKHLVTMDATPNERRMMHHRKKRIRRKYYNRVKRRGMG